MLIKSKELEGGQPPQFTDVSHRIHLRGDCELPGSKKRFAEAGGGLP
jgi:hypothetical protein